MGGEVEAKREAGIIEIYEKMYWKDKECYKCGEKGHPDYHCTNNKKGKDNNDKTKRTTSSRASAKKLARTPRICPGNSPRSTPNYKI